MILKKRHIPNKTIVFIIGSGRSGTHLLARSIESSSQIRAFIEDEQFFSNVSEVATQSKIRKKRFKPILQKYRKAFEKIDADFILEKSHPNIWMVEYIRNYFERSKFIGIRRDPYGTIASMLNHGGILRWYDRLPLDEVNPFLGITKENKKYFKSLPLESKCALRWKAHRDRLEYLEKKYPKEVLLIRYEDFYHNKETINNQLMSFIGLSSDFQIEDLNEDGLHKWKKTLTPGHISNINEILGVEYITHD